MKANARNNGAYLAKLIGRQVLFVESVWRCFATQTAPASLRLRLRLRLRHSSLALQIKNLKLGAEERLAGRIGA